MGLDPLSPIAPARIRALLLPLGRIKQSRFQSFVHRLEPEAVVRLGDVSPDGRPNRSTSPPAHASLREGVQYLRLIAIDLDSNVFPLGLSHRHDTL